MNNIMEIEKIKLNTIEEAIQLAYAGVDHINWQDMIFRQDIGWRAIYR